ncbi:hypothetical protein ASG85_32800 [Paenibacillus sp. Soil724D2]|nr:hypothetical protein ASG85_32800 [Paenibacillus sp. Soil724D2]
MPMGEGHSNGRINTLNGRSDMKQVIQHLLSFTPTRIVLALALFVPFLFTVIWMTGYHNATQRLGVLQIAVVNKGRG